MHEALHPVVVVVITMFGSFVLVLGIVSIWSALPGRDDRKA
jgi:hypothetical protein